MRRNNAKSKVSVYNSGRGVTGQTLLYQHMSNHYRRILNAKKLIDTAPPVTFKAKHNTCTSSSAGNKFSCNKKCVNGNISPALTERTTSTYTNGGSYWGTESCCGKKCQDVRDHNCDCRIAADMNPDVSEADLVNQISLSSKSGPGTCFHSSWKDASRRPNCHIYRSPYQTKTIGQNSAGNLKKQSATKSKVSALKRKLPLKEKSTSDLMEKHSKCFISHNSFFPRILKTNATSKLKNSKVYHPPRKKNGTKRASDWEGEMEKEAKPPVVATDMIKSKCTGMPPVTHANCKCKNDANPRETSQTSSRDSAYNGGVSSLPESRSPTPDQRKQKSCGCLRKEVDRYYENDRTGSKSIIVPNLKLTDNQDTQTEISHASLRKVEKYNGEGNIRSMHNSRPKQLNFKEETHSGCKNSSKENDREYFKKKIKEEALYTTFIRDITSEVLEKGLYTNKALKKVMKRHVISNLRHLDEDRMLKEIDKLRIQLGIPEDEDLMDIRICSTGNAADVDERCSVISDSELTELNTHKIKDTKYKKKPLSKNYTATQSYGENCESDFPKCISEVMYQTGENNEELESESEDEDEELISVIQVPKLTREKKFDKEFSDASENVTQGHSADESEQSSDYVSRKKKSHSRFRKIDRTFSSSDDRESSKLILDNRRFYAEIFDTRMETVRDIASPNGTGANSFAKDLSETNKKNQ